MKKFNVTMPVTGIAYIPDIEAESEEDALNKAFGMIDITHLEEWSVHEYIVRGNVFYGMINEYEVEECDESNL